MAPKRLRRLTIVILVACSAAGFALFYSWDVAPVRFPMTTIWATTTTTTTTKLGPPGTDLTIMTAPLPHDTAVADPALARASVNQVADPAIPRASVNQIADPAIPRASVNQIADPAIPRASVNQIADSAIPRASVNQIADTAIPRASVNQRADSAIPRASVNQRADPAIVGAAVNQIANPAIAGAVVNPIRASSPSGLGEEEKWIDTRAPTRQQSFAVINDLVMAGTMDFRRVARFQLDDEYLTTSDVEILMDGPLNDLTRVASPNMSFLEFVGGPTADSSSTVSVRVGDEVKVHVVLLDEMGRPVLKGGHEVRVWMVGKETVKKAAAVDVTDLRNGTYIASLPVLFGGKVEVRAALLRPREFRRIVLVLMNTMKQLNQPTASFVNGTTEQVTLCSFIPVVPGFPEVCNLTSQNSGLPWFCGRPTTPGLHCDHWTWSSHGGHPTHYPVSDTENALIARFAAKKESINKLQSTLSFVAEGKEKPLLVNKTCVPLKPRDTWTDRSPRGFWENNEWRPLTGCPLPPLTSYVAFWCLRNTHLLFLGDSNARQILEVMLYFTRCRQLPDPLLYRHPNMLHVPATFLCPQQNLQLSWYPHAYPFYTGYRQWSDSRVKYSLSRVLARLPADKNFVIVMHLYIHFSQVHTYDYVRHVRDAANSIRKLLKRNPKVRVFVRGPHAVGGNMYCLPGDYHAERSLRILRHEFRDLRDRVVFLNAWDMTVANENCSIHPAKQVELALCKLILSHLCPINKF